MELFTLGADRGGYSETGRPRAGTRSDRMDETPLARRSATTTSATTRPGTTTGRSPSSARAARTSGRTRAACACATANHPSFFVRKLWDYFIPSRRAARPSRSCRSCTPRSTRCGQSSPRSSSTRRSTPRRAWSSLRSSTPPACCAPPGEGSTRQQWSAVRPRRPASLDPPNVAGWDETRWLDTATFRGALEPGRLRAEASALDPKRDTARRARAQLLAARPGVPRAPRADAGDAPRPARLCPPDAAGATRRRRTR